MVKSRMSSVEIKRLLEKHRNFRGTSKELSDLTGISRKTIQNRSANGTLTKDYGIVLDNDWSPSSDVQFTPDISFETFKVLVNAVHYAHDLPLPYKNLFKETTAFRYHSLDTEVILTFLSDVEKSGELCLDGEDYYNLVTCYDILSFASMFKANVKKSSSKLIVDEFINSHGFKPSLQQIKAVSSIIRYARGEFGMLHRARIEAIAGSGKSVVCSVATKILETVYGMPTINMLSLSSFVASNNTNGKTLASLIGDKTKLKKSSFEELGKLQASLEIRSRSPLHTKASFVIVDEFSTLPSGYQSIIESLYSRVLYVGDSSQIRANNSDFGPPLCTLSEQYRFINSETDLQVKLSKYIFNGQLKEFSDTVENACTGYFTGKLMYVAEGNNIRITTDYTGALDSILETEVSKGLYNKLTTVFLGYSKRIVKEINLKLNGGNKFKVGSIVSLKNYIYLQGGDKVSTGKRFKVYGITEEGNLRLINDECTIEVKQSQIELAFAMTSFKAQGGAWDHVVYFGNTAYQDQQYADMYSSISRAKISVTVYLRDSVDVQKIKLLNLLKPFVKGDRNNKLNKDLYTYLNEANLSGLSPSEIIQTLESVLKSTLNATIRNSLKEILKSTEKESSSKTDTALPEVPQKLTKNYGFVLITGYDEKGNELKWYPNGENQRNKTKEEAQYLLDQFLKTGKYITGYLTEELCGGNRIVIDCDNEKTVNLFLKYKDVTESYYSKDSMHLVFTVDKFFKRSSFNQEDGFKGDLLGNATHSLRNVKDNKTPNYKEAVPLPVEVEQLLSQLTR